jgi:hypothetical protein
LSIVAAIDSEGVTSLRCPAQRQRSVTKAHG